MNKLPRAATRPLAVVLAAALLLAGCQKDSGGSSASPFGSTGSTPDSSANIVQTSRQLGQARGFFVSAEDLFALGGSTLESQQAALAAMADFAANSHLNTIFVEVRHGAAALYHTKRFPLDARVAGEAKNKFDPLKALCTEAATRQVQVVAVVNPYLTDSANIAKGDKNPLEKLPALGEQHLDPASPELQKLVTAEARELVKRYDLAGLLLDGMDAAFAQSAETAVTRLIVSLAQAARKERPGFAVGVAFDAANPQNVLTIPVVEGLAAQGAIDLAAPRLGAGLDEAYLSKLHAWAGAELGTAALYLQSTCPNPGPRALQDELLASAMEGGIAGVILSPYRTLAGWPAEETELLVSLFSDTKAKSPLADLAFPKTLAVTYPASGSITVSDDAIYLMGTSDPAQPLTLDGAPVERIGTLGTFGVSVTLKEGENAITLAQGNATASVRVTRTIPPTGPLPITQITAGTLFPTSSLGVNSNESLAISCVGPAGASITATLNGNTAVMTQAGTVKSGLPAIFRASFVLNTADFAADKVTNIGKITYVMEWSGGSAVQHSQGEVLVAGKNVPLTVQVPDSTYVCSVLTDPASDDNFTQSLKAGARAAVADRTIVTRNGNPVVAYQLVGGGYLLGSRVEVVENPAKCTSALTDITKAEGTDWEEYTFAGGQPGVLAQWAEDKLTLKFLSAAMTADFSLLAGGLVQTVEKAEAADGVTLTLTHAPGSLWGYDITHHDDLTTLYLRRTPTQGKAFGKPLEGIKILLDPGHGGTDPGALGVAGLTGPTEAVLNLTYANAARFRLEQLGAEVLMTREEGEEKVSLDDRVFQAQSERPHFFLALHHNSAGLVKDLNGARRMEEYYWEAAALPLANSMMERLSVLERKATPPENAYYYVTRLTFAPATLFELGFVVNPAEYEDACSAISQLKAGNAIAMAVLDVVPKESA